MTNKNKSLMKYKESFFNKIKNWFKSIFHKKNNSDFNNEISNSDSNNEMSEPQITNDPSVVNVFNKEKVELYNNQIEKKKFFKLYEQVKNNEIDIDSLTYDEIRKINSIMFEEIKIKSKDLDKLRLDNKQLEDKISKLYSKI